jgi:transcriptional regulator with XRE-family HTH domain
MASAGSRRLGEALDALLRRRGVPIAHVMRVAHLSRNTITALRRGATHQSSPETLLRIARALATDATTLEVDDFEMRENAAILNAAYGYADIDAQQTKTLLELALYHHFKSPARARAWDDGFREFEHLTVDEIRAFFAAARERA